MKLLICIIDNMYADEVEIQLRKKGYRMTELASSGGFWKKGNTTFLFGIEDQDFEGLSKELKAICMDVEEKKQRSSKQKFRYTSFLLDAKDAHPFIGV
ncbi:transcriptional regulator [bacterium LRH843]|nr:transcriptional regulator [bacterium LRH843]